MCIRSDLKPLLKQIVVIPPTVCGLLDARISASEKDLSVIPSLLLLFSSTEDQEIAVSSILPKTKKHSTIF